MLKETKDHSLGIKLFDLLKIKCNFHYHRSGEYEHVALTICNADTQCAVCRRFQFYAVLKIIIYEGLDQQLSLSTRLRTSRAEGYGITKLNYKYGTSEHGSKLGVHRSLGSSESLFRDRVST
jgi:hypothetical protein